MTLRRVGSWCAVVAVFMAGAAACGGSDPKIAPVGNLPAPAPAADEGADGGAAGHVPQGDAPRHGGRTPTPAPSPGERHSGVPLSPQEAASVRPEEPSFAGPGGDLPEPPQPPADATSPDPGEPTPAPGTARPPSSPPASRPATSAPPAPTSAASTKPSSPPSDND